MYDFADSAIMTYGQGGIDTKFGATSAIMNLLSTYGYGSNDSGSLVPSKSKSLGQGPNRGLSRKQNLARITSVGPYTNDAQDMITSIGKNQKDDPLINPNVQNVANTGMYVPVYYPIQQQELPIDPEMTYRFQMVSLIPYQTLAYEISRNGFTSGRDIKLSYDNSALVDLDAIQNYYSRIAALSAKLDSIGDEEGPSLGNYEMARSIIVNPQTVETTSVGDLSGGSALGQQTWTRHKDINERVDNALIAFTTSRMNADNVHDLVDIVRSVPGVKYETFVRYYNPIKSAGGANDIFLTRVSPAQTTYMPTLLTKGYECAGGVTNNPSISKTSLADYDFFSIPSFAPCFAAHTAEDTYYGSLTYELRPFYTRDNRHEGQDSHHLRAGQEDGLRAGLLGAPGCPERRGGVRDPRLALACRQRQPPAQQAGRARRPQADERRLLQDGRHGRRQGRSDIQEEGRQCRRARQQR